MFIETEGTPNPATLKFLPGRYVMGEGTADFASPSSAERSPLATALFDLEGVARVFLGGDFISVTKADDVGWQALKPQVLGVIMDHFGKPAMFVVGGCAVLLVVFCWFALQRKPASATDHASVEIRQAA